MSISAASWRPRQQRRVLVTSRSRHHCLAHGVYQASLCGALVHHSDVIMILNPLQYLTKLSRSSQP